MTPKTRGAGYCLNEACSEYHSKIFVMNVRTGDLFSCPKCQVLGWTETENGVYKGEGEFFREVQVEFDFDPATRVYKSVAIVRDNNIESGMIYVMRSPLITTEKRALKLAESMLSGLNVYNSRSPEGVPDSLERILDVNSDTFHANLKTLAVYWERFGDPAETKE